MIGRASFTDRALAENYAAALDEVVRLSGGGQGPLPEAGHDDHVDGPGHPGLPGTRPTASSRSWKRPRQLLTRSAARRATPRQVGGPHRVRGSMAGRPSAGPQIASSASE